MSDDDLRKCIDMMPYAIEREPLVRLLVYTVATHDAVQTILDELRKHDNLNPAHLVENLPADPDYVWGHSTPDGGRHSHAWNGRLGSEPALLVVGRHYACPMTPSEILRLFEPAPEELWVPLVLQERADAISHAQRRLGLATPRPGS